MEQKICVEMVMNQQQTPIAFDLKSKFSEDELHYLNKDKITESLGTTALFE